MCFSRIVIQLVDWEFGAPMERHPDYPNTGVYPCDMGIRAIPDQHSAKLLRTYIFDFVCFACNLGTWVIANGALAQRMQR